LVRRDLKASRESKDQGAKKVKRVIKEFKVWWVRRETKVTEEQTVR
jgi:hypothetical protein